MFPAYYMSSGAQQCICHDSARSNVMPLHTYNVRFCYPPSLAGAILSIVNDVIKLAVVPAVGGCRDVSPVHQNDIMNADTLTEA